jgi:hypothetical protein
VPPKAWVLRCSFETLAHRFLRALAGLPLATVSLIVNAQSLEPLKPPAGWKPEMGYINPFPNDQPIEQITRVNVKAHEEKLSPGLHALLNRYPDFRIPVYVTRRVGADSQEVLAKHAPFPEPKNGIELITNVLRRDVGGGTEREGRAFPVRANGQTYPIEYWSRRIYASNLDSPEPNLLFVAVGGFLSPPTLRGKLVLIHEPISIGTEPRKAWIYDPAQRRVRRAPDLAYDAVPEASEGMFTADQVDGFSGSPDRFDWNLIGKQPMLVPYNTYEIGLAGTQPEKLLRKGSVNPDLMRYELHRVWVLEATLKQGQSHVYGKRRFYIDEDSWTVLMEEAYSRRGDLWRVALHGLAQAYDVGVPWIRVSIYHDLDSGSYFVGGLDTDRKPSIRFNQRGSMADFSPDALRRSAR